jgi:hypothetical protein
VTDPEHTSSEHTVVEAVLKADDTGYWVKHPFVRRPTLSRNVEALNDTADLSRYHDCTEEAEFLYLA